ncbi:MAG: hypothetical protein WDN72_09660 [Alphaproteobacteria bacterium]
MEYIVVIDHGRTLSIAQEVGPDDVVLQARRPRDGPAVRGRRVLQEMQEGEGYQRVLPAGDVEDKVKPPANRRAARVAHQRRGQRPGHQGHHPGLA